MRLFLFLLGVLATEAHAESVREVPVHVGFYMEREGASDVSNDGLKNCWRWVKRSNQPDRLVHFNQNGEANLIALRGQQRPELRVLNGELFAFCDGRTFRFAPQWEERKVDELAVLPVTREYYNLWGGRYLCSLPELVTTSSTQKVMTTQWVEQITESLHEDSPNVEAPATTAPAPPTLPSPEPTPVPQEKVEPTAIPPKPQGTIPSRARIAKA